MNIKEVFQVIAKGNDTVTLNEKEFINLFNSLNANAYSSEEFGGWLQLADVRNKLSPITTFISLFNRLNGENISKEDKIKIKNILMEHLKSVESSISYLAQREDLFKKDK